MPTTPAATTPRATATSGFNQLFPLGHAFFGHQDFIGRQNLGLQPKLGASSKPIAALLLRGELLSFWRADTDDVRSTTPAAACSAPPEFPTKSHVGIELDLTATYMFDSHTSLETGYAHFFSGVIEDSGASEDIDWFYAASYRF